MMQSALFDYLAVIYVCFFLFLVSIASIPTHDLRMFVIYDPKLGLVGI
jgi:hypothetical protein